VHYRSLKVVDSVIRILSSLQGGLEADLNTREVVLKGLRLT
jgi:hypothetical protein